MIKFGPGEAEKMLVSLSRMLRYSIQNGKDVVTVKEEMDSSAGICRLCYTGMATG